MAEKIYPKQVIFGTTPSKSNSYKIIQIKGVSTLGKTAAVKNYEKDFFIQCNHYRDLNIMGYFELYMDVYYPNQRSDLDNSAKVVLDCLQIIKAIKNDNKLVKMVLRKFLDKANSRIEFVIKEINNPD
jgi:Holliday junction resolvase RusA-like endonuclease